MADLLTPDLCVIGMGAGGVAAAAAASAFRVPVVLVDASPEEGQSNPELVASKALVSAGHRVHRAKAAAAFGLSADPGKPDFAAVQAHARRVSTNAALNRAPERLAGMGIRVVRGTARFVNSATLAVDDRFEIMPRRFVIAGRPQLQAREIAGLNGTPYLTPQSLSDLNECPRHLLVLGAGATALELAQAFSRLGADVTVIAPGRALATHDPECAEIVMRHLLAEGIRILQERTFRSVSRGDGITLQLQHDERAETVTGSHLLLTEPYLSAPAALDLDKAGVAVSEARVVVDRRLRTTNRKIYSISEVLDGEPAPQLAEYQAGLVVQNALFRKPIAAQDHLVARMVWTDPELAHVGLREQEARERYRAIRILRWPLAETDRARAEGDLRGHLKVITSGGGKILGATVVGPGAGELIAPWALAVAQSHHIRAMKDVILAYPTRSQAGPRAALDFFAPGLTSPWLRRIIGFGRLFG